MSGPQEYVGMLQDACTLQKNIVMTRAFHQVLHITYGRSRDIGAHLLVLVDGLVVFILN